MESFFEGMATRTHDLMRAKQFREAHTFLQSEERKALDAHDAVAASYCCSLLGSVLVAEQKPEEALAAYLRAEEHRPTDPSVKTAIARHLLALGRFDAALEKAREAQATATQESGWKARHDACAVIGLALLHLSDKVGAEEALKQLASSQMLSGLRARSFDLSLVRALMEHRVALDRVRIYLQKVQSEAIKEMDSHTAEMASSLLGRLNDLSN